MCLGCSKFLPYLVFKQIIINQWDGGYQRRGGLFGKKDFSGKDEGRGRIMGENMPSSVYACQKLSNNRREKINEN